MTKVLLCANNIDEIGGAQRVVHLLAHGLHGRGHDVQVVGMTPFEPRHDFGGTYPRTAVMSRSWPARSPRNERIRAQLRAQAVARIAGMLKAAEEPAVLICAQVWSMEIIDDALAAVSPAVRSRWSVIGQYHGSFAAAASGRDLGRVLRSYRSIAAFTALTVEDGRAFARAGLNNVQSMPNPLAFWPTAPTDRSNVDSRVLLYLGRLSQEKGADVLIDAWSLIADRHPDWWLRIVGDGPQADELKAQARSLAGAERIQWSGFTHDPATTLMDSDLLVLPSRTEGLPLVVAESQACGVPVVASDCSSGVRQLIGDWGRLVPRDDSRALASALAAAMSDRPWRLDAGRRARIAMERYRVETVLDDWERLIRRVLL